MSDGIFRFSRMCCKIVRDEFDESLIFWVIIHAAFNPKRFLQHSLAVNSFISLVALYMASEKYSVGVDDERPVDGRLAASAG
jgi:hypothetical protein